MSLDAGTVKSRLDLDTTSFKGGFSEAHTHAESEGGHIREILESIAEMATEVCGPAFGQLSQEIQSAFAGFSEGPLVGALNAIAVAAGQVREAVGSTVDDLHELGLAAEKAGVSVEWMDKMANVGKTAGVGLEQLGQGLRTLEERGEAAEQGDNKAMESFNRLGISATELASLLKDPQELFDRVHDSLGNMTDASMRQTEAHNLLGRAGQSLIPIFAMSKQQFDDLAETMDKLSGGATKASVETANSMFTLEKEIGAAWEGIERIVSKPILKFFQDHAEQILPMVQALVDHVEAGITSAWTAIAAASDAMVPGLEAIWTEIKTNLSPAFNKAEDDAKALWPVFKEVATTLFDDLKPALSEIIPIVGELMGIFETFVAGALTHFLNGLHELEPVIKHIADGIAGLMEHIKEGFQIVGSVTGYYDNPNDFSGDAGQATRGLSRKQIEEKLSGSVEHHDTLPPQHVEQLKQSIDNLSSHISDVTNRSSAPSSFREPNETEHRGAASARSAESGAGITINASVSPQFDPTESANQLAKKLLPLFRDIIQRQNNALSGAVSLGVARAAMGGH